MSSEQLPLFGDAGEDPDRREAPLRGGTLADRPSGERRAIHEDANASGRKQQLATDLKAPAVDPDVSARQYAVDPRNNVVLEASAGTGKTSVLVSRYINLLKSGVEPSNILAITFTRKAAAEMRERIVRELRTAAARSEFDKARWTELRDRMGEIAISTIDAFCLSLLREFPLEADIDPGFEMADETEVPRLVDDALDRSLRIFAKLARDEPDIALVLAQLGTRRTREGLAILIARRLVAWDALNRFLARGPSELTAATVCRRAAAALHDLLRTVPGGLAQFLADGPVRHPRYDLLLRDIGSLADINVAPDAVVRGRLERIAAHFLTQEGTPRLGGQIRPYATEHYVSPIAAKRHREGVFQIAPQIERVMFAFNRDLNVILARGIRRMFAIALAQYRRALDERSVLDFADVLERAVELLRRMDEFSQSRFRLESRYHHVLVDEFQDTSRAQWELVSLLIQSWGEGLGLPTHPSIFIVGDRKQSIYRFRDAELAVMREAGRQIESLRPGDSPRRSIARSFRAVPELLAFVNDVFTEIGRRPVRADDFAYGPEDRFPVAQQDVDQPLRGPALGIAVGGDAAECAASVAHEIARILREETVRDRKTGIARAARPADIGILFRSRSSHREFERELSAHGIPTYVYKGLGFFDADEIKDTTALLRYLADSSSNLRAAALLRSRFVRLSDAGLARLAPHIAEALTGTPCPNLTALDDADRHVLTHLRKHVPGWIARVDRIPPADLLEGLLRETAYSYELRGADRQQAWENLKKMRALVRRIQNRGYATLPRIADHIDALTAGDESNAVLEALDAVNLMTVHAAKGLEFPVVFVVNLARGASGPPKPVRVIVDTDGTPSVSVGPFVPEIEEADREREQQETRRLLYVALTRARDRLYLSSSLKDGALAPGRGSLAEVLPESIKPLFAHAAAAFPEMSTIAWTGESGRTFEWRVCRMPPSAARVRDKPANPAPDHPSAASTTRQPPRTAETVNATAWVKDEEEDFRLQAGAASELMVGRLVHRILGSGDRHTAAQDLALSLLTSDERATLDNVDEVASRAGAVCEALRARPDIAILIESGTCLHEVPFSMSVQESDSSLVVRGTIDLLVIRDDGSVLVVEFKTGRQRPSHERQLDVYLRAARALYPGRTVEGWLLYA